MITWKTVRLTDRQLRAVALYGQQEWNTRSPSEALRIILADYFASRELPFPDVDDIQWGGPRLSHRKSK